MNKYFFQKSNELSRRDMYALKGGARKGRNPQTGAEIDIPASGPTPTGGNG